MLLSLLFQCSMGGPGWGAVDAAWRVLPGEGGILVCFFFGVSAYSYWRSLGWAALCLGLSGAGVRWGGVGCELDPVSVMYCIICRNLGLVSLGILHD